ncbi:hypothetical protein [Nonomuraea soli]|uniref:Lipoprotein n=1 Tax=Nonomuraea soli TaxID=1032476 RepID=A0A7W0CM75_9ACTN|nr:hypothetical protein [Nonomuraea soli]
MLFALLLTGCTMTQPAINRAQALTRVEELIHDTTRALTPRPRLEALPSFNAPTGCLDDDEHRVVISRAYWLRDVPATENMAVSRQIRAHWESRGHRITASGGPGLNAETRTDGFLLALVWSEGDALYLGVSSPCITPS